MVPFKNILIPVDTQEHLLMAVEKAVELCAPVHSHIHLISPVPSPATTWERFWEKLAPGKQSQKAVTAGALSVEGWNAMRELLLIRYPGHPFLFNTAPHRLLEQECLRYIGQQAIDLVIAPHAAQKKLIRLIAANAGTPILTIAPGSLSHPVRSILLPVYSFMPEIRIQASLEFARKYNAQIHLVTVLNDNESHSKERVDAFYLTYKLLAEYGYSPHYKILQGRNSTESLLRYANHVKADLIFADQAMTDMLPPLSAIQVLMLQPNIR